MMESLYNRLDAICGTASRMFLEGESHDLKPMLFFEHDGKVGICPLKMESLEDKELVAMGIETLIRDMGVREYVMVVEVWMAKRSSLSDIDRPVREMPDKVEAILVHYCSPKKNVLRFAEINRDGDSVTLGKWEKEEMINTGTPSHDTRFGNIFERVLSESN